MRGQGPAAEADALALLGQVAQAAGDPGRAAGLYRDVLELARRLPDPGEAHPVLYRDTGDQPGVAVALEGAATLIAPDRPALALRLAGAAAALPPAGPPAPLRRPSAPPSTATSPAPAAAWAPRGPPACRPKGGRPAPSR